MKKILLLILVFSCIFCQDKLTLIDGTIYEGKFISFLNNHVIFKPSFAMTGQKIDIEKIKLITLSDGTLLDVKLEYKSENMFLAGQKLDQAGKHLIVGTFMIPLAGYLTFLTIIPEPTVFIISGLLSIGYNLMGFNQISIAGKLLQKEYSNN